MVFQECEMMNSPYQGDEVESTLLIQQQSNQQQNNDNDHNNNNKNLNPLITSLGRQNSIYSLTLDEFQHTLCENGKNFGSMNMDEFLNSIWSAEENHQAINSNNNFSLRKQPSLPRQGSLTIPTLLCTKTVDEVWAEIQKEQQNQNNNNNNKSGVSKNNVSGVNNSDSFPHQPTFGDMTLEDFLVKAGVVREQPCAMEVHQTQHQHQHQQYGMYSNINTIPGPVPVIGIGGEAFRYAGNGKMVNKYPSQTAVIGAGYQLAPVSPVSSDGQFGMEMGVVRGRKRILDAPVERRQRRMIKNRESAARSRARKQAYTVELEAELSQLREENAQLKQALTEFEKRRKQQSSEKMNVRVQTKAEKATKKLRSLRRTLSCS